MYVLLPLLSSLGPHGPVLTMPSTLADNHKPTLSSETAPSSAKVKPSSSSSATTPYDLSFTDDGGKYAYTGNRTTKENQYVLIFDPERKAFVLHRLDSTLNMNLTRTPSNTDAEALREEHPHIDSSIRVSTDKKGAANSRAKKGKGSAAKNAGFAEKKRSTAPAASASSKGKASSAAAAESAKQQKAKEEQQKKEQSKPAKRAADSEEEDSDDDGDLLIEYPDPQPAAVAPPRPQQTRSSDFQPPIRRFSEFMANQGGDDESDEDADGEFDEDDLLVDEAGDSSAGDGFKLPSPVGRTASAVESGLMDAEGEAEEDVPEMDDMDLEAEMLRELAGDDGDSESSVSEED